VASGQDGVQNITTNWIDDAILGVAEHFVSKMSEALWNLYSFDLKKKKKKKKKEKRGMGEKLGEDTEKKKRRIRKREKHR